MKYNNEVLVIIVLYKQKLAESKSFISLSNSLIINNIKLDLFVYDNSPEFNQQDLFERYDNWNITYHPDVINSGVSKAYNTGARFAVNKKKKWMLLLDQDTDFPAQTIKEYFIAIERYPESRLFAPIMLTNKNDIISPCYFKFMRGFRTKHINIGVNSLNKFSIINCGMCVNVNAFMQNKGYKASIKLDFSDHDFIQRFKLIDNKFTVINLHVYHQLSSETKNSMQSDIVRFKYYLEGANHMESNFTQSIFLKINATLRALKLSVRHKNLIFIKQISRSFLKY